jgi:disease resistance protein RPM1
MHGIMRDLGCAVAKREKFESANNYSSMITIDRYVRLLSSYRWNANRAMKLEFPYLRTLVSLGTISSSHCMLSSILSGSIYLTVVELQDSEITEVPESVGALFNLRYIGLRRTNVKSLPDSICKLYNLQTLDIRQTKIKNLPRVICKVY